MASAHVFDVKVYSTWGGKRRDAYCMLQFPFMPGTMTVEQMLDEVCSFASRGTKRHVSVSGCSVLDPDLDNHGHHSRLVLHRGMRKAYVEALFPKDAKTRRLCVWLRKRNHPVRPEKDAFAQELEDTELLSPQQPRQPDQ
jgi:hypothetical protein